LGSTCPASWLRRAPQRLLKEGDDQQAVTKASQVCGCPAGLVPGGWIGTPAEEKRDNVSCSESCCEMQGSPSFVITGFEISPGVKQDRDRLGAAGKGSVVKRRELIAATGIGIRTAFKECTNRLDLADVSSLVQGRVGQFIASLEISTGCGNGPDGLGAPPGRSTMEGCEVSTLTSCVGIRVAGQHLPDRFRAAVARGHMQCRRIVWTAGADIGTGGQCMFHRVRIAVPGGTEQIPVRVSAPGRLCRRGTGLDA